MVAAVAVAVAVVEAVAVVVVAVVAVAVAVVVAAVVVVAVAAAAAVDFGHLVLEPELLVQVVAAAASNYFQPFLIVLQTFLSKCSDKNSIS